LGIFVIIAYSVGHLIQSIGNIWVSDITYIRTVSGWAVPYGIYRSVFASGGWMGFEQFFEP